MSDNQRKLLADQYELLIEITRLKHDIHAYRGALGYPVPGDHNGCLSDGTRPNNGIAEALQIEFRSRRGA